MASFWYGETHAIFASFGHPARPQTRPEQLIDNTVDAIKFAWRPSLFASPLFPAVLAAEAKSRKVSSSPDCVRWWWDGTRGKEDDIKKEICNSFHLSLFLPLFCDSILSRLLPSEEKKIRDPCLHLAAAGLITQMRNNWSALLPQSNLNQWHFVQSYTDHQSHPTIPSPNGLDDLYYAIANWDCYK